MKQVVRFWASAFVAALIFTVLAAWFFPYRALNLNSGADRWQAWLLTLWTGGMMSICFGIAALLGYKAPLGVRDVADAGSMEKAQELHRGVKHGIANVHANFAWWLVLTGALLLGVYFVAWGVKQF